LTTTLVIVISGHDNHFGIRGPVVGNEWLIQLPNAVSVTFSGTLDAGT